MSKEKNSQLASVSGGEAQQRLTFISVIVPVYEHWDVVFNLIEALETQNLDKAHWELILVDNGSSSIPESSLLPKFSRLLHCSKPGSYAARNKGIQFAKGELIVFTDADCQPKKDWLENILNAYSCSGKDQIIAGAVDVRLYHEKIANSVELYDIALGIPQELYVERGFAATANLAIPKHVFEKVGYFDERRFSGGDGELCRRAYKHGFTVFYEPKAIIEHPARSSWSEIETKIRRVKGGKLSTTSISAKAREVFRAFVPPVRAYIRLLKSKKLSSRGKLVTVWVQTKLWFVEMSEVTRLILGAKPERR